MKLDLRKYGTTFTRDDIYTELEAIGAQPSDIQYVTIAPGSEIPESAFYKPGPDVEIIFPNLELVYNLNTCVSIGNGAFMACPKLRNTDISNASTIGNSAFAYCTGLTNIRIQPGISIPERCFDGCSNLRVVYNLNKCQSIETGAFVGCSSLQTVDISSCSNIGEYAFEYCTNLTTVKLQPGIELKEGTFYGCTSLTTVYNLHKCTALNPENYIDGVFTGCQSLRNSDLSSCSHIGSKTFLDCASLTSMKLASGVEIYDEAFYGCAALSRVDNIKQCRYIGERAFYGCGELKNLDVSSAGYIGKEAFHNTSLETLKLGNAGFNPEEFNSSTLFGTATSTLREVTIPSGWFVPNYLFSGCSNLEVVYNLAYATGIGDTAFQGCGKLSNSQLLSCSSIGNEAFLGCSAVAFSNLPASPTIGTGAFYDCGGITKMTITSGTVGSGAFYDCDNLSKVTIIGSPVMDSAFAGCGNLEKVEIRGGTDLGVGAFFGCSKLKEVTLGTETFGIGAQCFADCSSLEKIYNLGLATNTWMGSEFLSGVNLENNTIVANASTIADFALSGCNMPEWNLPNIYTSELLGKYYFAAPEGTTFKCADGTTYVQPYNTKIWFDDGTFSTVAASQDNTLTRDDLVEAGLMTSRYEWTKQPTRVAVGANTVTLGNDLFNGCHKLSTVLMMSSNTGLENGVFANCTALKDIDLGYVFNLGSNAFEGCTSLKKAIVPNVESIHGDTFNGCTSLSKVELSPNLTSISNRAFKGCTSLSSITIPSMVNYMGTEAFAGSGLATATIKGSETLTIGSGSGQFKNCTNLTKVTLPSSGCEVPDECFKNCNRLQTVYNLNKCTDIGDYAFFGCSTLTNNDVSKCNSIGEHAFQGCSAILQIRVKSGANVGDYSFIGCGSIGTMYNLSYVSSIGDNALSGLSLSNNTIKALDSGLTSKSLSGCLNESWNLPNVYVAEAEAKNWYGANQGATLKCKDGTIVSDNQDSLTTINGTDKVLLKGNVDRSVLEAVGYDPSSIDTIEFGTGVTSIGNYAFRDCSGLTSVTILDSVTSIGSAAFSGCTTLSSITLPDIVTSIGTYAFHNCSGLTNVVIPNDVTSIKWGVFRGCSSLTSVTIPDSTTSIGNEAFRDCSALTSVIFEGDEPTLDQTAFTNVASGCAAYVNGSLPKWSQYPNGSRWYGLTIVYKEHSETRVKYTTASGITPREQTFNIEGELTSDSIPNISNVEEVDIGNAVTSIGDWSFQFCDGLTSVTIPNSVTNIGESAFNGCSGLTNVTIPDSVTIIGTSAFASCSGLTNVTIGNGVMSIGWWAFASCSGLTNVTIGNSVTEIRGQAFGYCSNLTSVRIPDSVTSIGEGIFSGCSSLLSLSVATGNPSYKSVTGLLLTKDGKTLVAGVNGDVTIPDSVTSIESYAFSGLINLTSVTIGNSVTSIRYEAFSGCSGLTNVTIPDSVTKIEGAVFYNCTGLTSVTIGNSVTKIEEATFDGCSALTSLTFLGKTLAQVQGMANYSWGVDSSIIHVG